MKQENIRLSDDALEQVSGGTGPEISSRSVPQIEQTDFPQKQLQPVTQAEDTELGKIGHDAFGNP